MDEVYTCICKGQAFSIHDGFIRCSQCRKEYEFKRIKDLAGRERIDLECVTDFNERVKQDEHGGLVAKEIPFTKKLIDEKEA